MTKMIVTAGIGLGLQTIDVENLGLLFYCRVLFTCAQLLCLGFCVFIRFKIMAIPDSDTVVHVPAVTQFGQQVSPAMSLSVKEYDLTKWKEQVTQMVIGCLMCYGIHMKFEYTTPLAIQIFLAPTSILESPLAQVHLLQNAAKGSLKRPWATVGPFSMIQEAKKEAKKKLNEAKKDTKSSGKKAGKGR